MSNKYVKCFLMGLLYWGCVFGSMLFFIEVVQP